MMTRRNALSVRVMIPDGDDSLALGVVQCLKRGPGGCHITLIQSDGASVCRYSRFIDRVVMRPAHVDAEEFLIHQLSQNPADVLLPVGSTGVALVIATRNRLKSLVKVPCLPAPEALAIAEDKWLLHQHLIRCGLPSPRTVLFEGSKSLNAFDRLEPVLIKPRHGCGGTGITWVARAGDVKDLDDTWESASGLVVIQEYLGGSDVDRSVLCLNGRAQAATTQYALIKGRRFQPSSALRFTGHPEGERIVSQLMRSLNWSGIAHVDMMSGPRTGKLYVLDLNPRYWASLLGSLSAGVNFPWLQVLATLSQALPVVEPKETLFSGLRNWPSLFLSRRHSACKTTFAYNISDPLPKIMLALRRNSSMGALVVPNTLSALTTT